MPELFTSGHGHIHSKHYAALISLLALKYEASTEKEREHLIQEWASTLQAFGIISGTIVAAEGFTMDLMQSYQEVSGNTAAPRDKIALVTMTASLLSPWITTVGSSGILGKTSKELADGDEKMMAVFQSHVSNLSEYLLFGDPPFIAVNNKYGFEQGLTWQATHMWPLAIQSLLLATYKLNKYHLEREGMSPEDVKKQARADALQGVRDNIGYLAKIMMKSFINMKRYLHGAPQDPAGIEVRIVSVLQGILSNIAKLPWSADLDHAGHDGEGMTTDDPEERVAKHILERALEQAAMYTPRAVPKNSEQNQERITTDLDITHKDLHTTMAEAIKRSDYDTVQSVASIWGIDSQDMKTLISLVKEVSDKGALHFVEDTPAAQSFARALHPVRLYENMTNVNRLKNALGHNLGDVLDVFMFQAGCIPFLKGMFRRTVDAMDAAGVPPKLQETFIFFLLMAFSMVADNYVACEIGLELYPDKPELALIASIQGGSHSAIGNMANIAQFDLNTFSLKASLSQLKLHTDNIMIGFCYKEALALLRQWNIGFVPAPVQKSH